MRWRSLLFVVCVGSILSSLSVEVLNSNVYVWGSLIKQQSVQLSEKQLHQLAESITVKVLSEEFLGSGAIVDKQGSVYTILTNEHVLRAAEPPYHIQTPNGRVYTANLPQAISFDRVDLALLQFRSTDTNYAVASLGNCPTVGERVFIAGFPLVEKPDQNQSFVFRTGKVLLVLGKALQGGYRIGYTNYVEKGMSGGPLLNLRGEVVSINGMHAEPLWGDPYAYEDGSEPDPNLKEKMSRYSWGIPIERYLEQRKQPI